MASFRDHADFVERNGHRLAIRHHFHCNACVTGPTLDPETIGRGPYGNAAGVNGLWLPQRILRSFDGLSV
jgi:hypothetical protein